MKNLFILIFTLFYYSAYSQQDWKKPNYKKIESECKNSKSNLFYDSLFQRYLRGDSSFSLDEKQHLYYGFQFTSKYSPYGDVHYTDSLNTVLSNDDLNLQQYKTGIRYCDSILIRDPMNLKILNIQTNLYKSTKDFIAQTINMSRMNNVIDAILSSGDGKTDASAFYVLSIDQEYSILKILGLQFGGEQSLRGSNDYLKLEKNEYDLEGIYFDVTASFDHMNKLFGEK